MKKYCKCNISPKKVLQYCKSCNKQYFANTLQGTIGRPSDGHSGNYGGLLRGFWVYWLQGCWVNEKRYDIHWAMSMARSNDITKNLIRRRGLFWALHISTRTSLIIRYYLCEIKRDLFPVSTVWRIFQLYLYHFKLSIICITWNMRILGVIKTSKKSTLKHKFFTFNHSLLLLIFVFDLNHNSKLMSISLLLVDYVKVQIIVFLGHVYGLFSIAQHRHYLKDFQNQSNTFLAWIE